MTIDLPPTIRARLLRTRRWVLAGTASQHRRKLLSGVAVYYTARRGYRWAGRQPVIGVVVRTGVETARRAVRAVKGPR